MHHYAIQHQEFAINQLTAIRCALKNIKRNLKNKPPIMMSQRTVMFALTQIQRHGAHIDKLFVHANIVTESEFDILLGTHLTKMYQQYRQIQAKLGAIEPNEHANLMISLTKIGYRIISLAEKLHKSKSLRV